MSHVVDEIHMATVVEGSEGELRSWADAGSNWIPHFIAIEPQMNSLTFPSSVFLSGKGK